MKKRNILFIGLVLSMVFTGCASSQKSSSSASAPPKNDSYENAPATIPEEEGVLPHPHINPKTGAGGGGAAYPADDNNELYPNEEYLEIEENKEMATAENPMLTFSLKVDTASYNNVKRYIESGSLPPADAVKTEELINYFPCDTVLPETDVPFSIYTEIGASPFNENKNMAFIRVKSKDIDKKELPKSNLTFLIDTSGSMDSFDKLPLLKSAFSLLVETLTENDKVSIVTYAGSAGVVLDSVSGDQKDRMLKAIDRLDAGGSTAGAEGILTAYKLAEKNFIAGGNNRVILATDGDFNVGVSGVGDLEDLIAKKRDSGVYLSVLGFGTENLKDNKMETLSKNGNGNYAYIDSIQSAKKVLVDELASNLFTIADDVKSQIEFNPEVVSNYRLIGYENRKLRNEDFINDQKDAGEIGVGTDVVVMFELELTDKNTQGLKYQKEDASPATTGTYGDELFEVRIRYKDPGQSESKLITLPVKIERILDKNTSDFLFAVGVAEYGELLRNSSYANNSSYQDVLSLAKENLGLDDSGYRKEFVNLVKSTMGLQN